MRILRGANGVWFDANPPPDPTWTDPSRDWTLDNNDKINTASVYLDLLRAVRRTDIRLGYDYSDSGNSFVHGGPRVATLAAAGQFIPLPDVENTWHRLTADVQYFLTQRAGIGAGCYFDSIRPTDVGNLAIALRSVLDLVPFWLARAG